MSGLPVTTAGRRLLASAWALGEGEPTLVDTIIAIECEMVDRLTAADMATHRADASIVYIRRWTTAAPGALVYHALAWRIGERTKCGQTVYRIVRTEAGGERWMPELTRCRRDTADRIARPCKQCFGEAGA